MSSRIDRKAAAREKAAQIRAQQERAERRRRLLLATAAVTFVLVVIGALVVARLTGVGSGGSATPSGQASPALLSALRDIPASGFDQAGTGGAQGGSRKLDAPALTADGKPRVLYIGAEYCPYCAAERWSVAAALSRFGTFTKLGTTHSSSSDADPDTPTLSFHHSRYNSDLISFTGVETTTNKRTLTGYKKLDSPSATDEKIADKYDQSPYVSKGGSIPFIDIGGKYVSAGATYDPALLAGKTQMQVAKALSDPESPIAKAVNGSANLFTAAICQTTGNQPTAVCESSGVKAALAKIGS
jgi:thiol-disulfide isomerase/thioredoxin